MYRSILVLIFCLEWFSRGFEGQIRHSYWFQNLDFREKVLDFKTLHSQNFVFSCSIAPTLNLISMPVIVCGFVVLSIEFFQ